MLNAFWGLWCPTLQLLTLQCWRHHAHTLLVEFCRLSNNAAPPTTTLLHSSLHAPTATPVCDLLRLLICIPVTCRAC